MNLLKRLRIAIKIIVARTLTFKQVVDIRRSHPEVLGKRDISIVEMFGKPQEKK